jgi:flagellar biosynthesis protein FlhF
MLIKNFQAETIQKALDQVRREFGKQAVIMKTDIVKERGQKMFTVTAAKDDRLPQSQSMPRETVDRPLSRQIESRHSTPNLERILLDLLLPRVLCDRSRDIFLALREHEVDSQVAADFCARLEHSEAPADDLIAAIKESAPATTEFPQEQQTVLFIGPPGSGKSSTLAKFATRQVFSKGRRVKLTTLDNFRPTAEAEIKNLTEVLGFVESRRQSPLKDDTDELLLVDTEGLVPEDEETERELRAAIEQLEPCYRILVLSATANWRTNRRYLSLFGRFGIDALVVTGLDLTDSCGMLLNLRSSACPPLLGVTDSRLPTGMIQEFDVDQHLQKLIGDIDV